MTKVTDFKETINKVLDNEIEAAGIIVPNRFPLYKNECNKIISKIGNKAVVVTETILQDFTIIGNYVWNTLLSNRKLINYSIISYIAQHIKFNSNVIKLTPKRLRGYLHTEIANRDYYTAISFLENFSILGKCDITNCYTVNPIAIYKGNIYQFVNIVEEHGVQECIIDHNDKLLVDKAVVIKDKYANQTELIFNKKYYKEANKTISFNFNK